MSGTGPLDLKKIENCCRRATPGPWTVRDVFVQTTENPSRVVAVMSRRASLSGPTLDAVANAELIALSRSELPRLLEEIRWLAATLLQLADDVLDDEAARRLRDELATRFVDLDGFGADGSDSE